MRVGVCMCACGCVGGGDMVYGCEGLCQVYSLLIIFKCELLFILQHIFVTNIILSSNVYDSSIVCLLLRSLKF